MAELAGSDRDCRTGLGLSPWAVAQVQTLFVFSGCSGCHPGHEVSTAATPPQLMPALARLLTEQIDELALLWRELWRIGT